MQNRSKIKTEVLRQHEISTGIFDMLLYAPEIASCAKPGQFVMAYPARADKLLPRPISICDYDASEGLIRLVYRVTGKNTGTECFSELRAGESIEVMGPIGNGYDTAALSALAQELKDKKQAEEHENKGFWNLNYDIAVCGGGIGIPPLLGLVKTMNAEYPDIKCAAVLGFRNDMTFLLDEFRKYAEVYIATDDGSLGIHGNIIDAMKEEGIQSQIICACGPMPMLRGLAAYAGEAGIKTYVSLEERMACGVGACLGCVTKTKNKDAHSQVNNARICVDGPVFDVDVLDF